jgi:uroporphyrin-III C-methyltransferase
MGINNLPQICAGLLHAGLAADTPAAVIERGYSPAQRTTVTRLDRLAAEVRRVDVQSPAVVVLGEVVRLAGLGGTAGQWWDLERSAATGGESAP